ncbi:ABC-F type ribosomal protection protein [Clostridium sp. CX1]|uniref:ABC-F type ribosomal protection protein n=1 Tax=Clostridium tanneri TaxID=3037988 RepID=A0ABU4JQ27_9CLOT|nr:MULTISPECIES: ABC-F type ribosomal protection protein [unclassified Clostridium]MCT8975297.1 ABC-F type ribosomal protection protein [Clostridium sp. CX1]MDW8800221.1 ABC-F type ribosomal protection protein [Clostridium sp. A1-XYC3]
MLVKITNGCVAFGTNTILSNIDFQINAGEKVALVGRNGCGKTTLLKLISGEYELSKLDNGETSSISTARNITIGYLKQITFEDETITLEDEVKKAYKEISDIEVRMEKLLSEMESDSNSSAVKKYSELQERYNLLGGYTYKKEYEVAIKQFGFTDEDKAKALSEFSGGQRTKIAFIKLLLSKPDLLVLDEPTNHLDINAIEWLEEYLKEYKKAVLIVAHDREFLDKIASSVYEIERGKITRYTGNYSAFAEKKRLEWQIQQKKHIEQQKEIAHLSGLVERFRYKATKAAMAQSKIKQLDRMDIVEASEVADTKGFFADFEPEYQSVQLVLRAKDLEIGYSKTLSTVSLNITRGEKIGIIGGNGLGKSTFLKTIVGAIPKLGGTYSVGDKVKIGYFDQHMAQYKSDKTVLDEYWDEFPDLTQTEVRSALGAFLFTQEDVFKPVNALSGGEKVRLELCKILKRRPNFLILDEPTNHMDIIGKETLEKMLKDYTGTLIFVSHDRYFVKQIASSVLVFDKGNVGYYPFGYEDYLEKAAKKLVDKETTVVKEKSQKKKFTTPGKEKAKIETRVKKLEILLEKCDEKIAKLQEELQSQEVISDYVRLTELQEELMAQEEINMGYLEEWGELQDRLTEDSFGFRS